MTKEELRNNPLLLGRLKLFGLTKMHEQGYDGRGVVVANMDKYGINHGWNTESCINHPYINGQMLGTAPKCTIKRYQLPNNFNKNDVIKLLKECRVDEVDIINMSFGSPTDSKEVHEQIKLCHEQGIIMIASAGNEGLEYNDYVDIKLYPEEYEEVISVGSVDSDLSWSDFESHGKSIDMVGIGRQSVVMNKDGSYQKKSGTSMSAPQITGIFACVWSMFRQRGQNPLVEDIKQYVLDRCVDLGTQGRDWYYGYGLVTLDIIEHKETRRALGVIKRTIKMQIGNKTFEVDGKTQLMDTNPIIDENNRTLVPVRAIAEALGCEVSWDNDTRTITIKE